MFFHKSFSFRLQLTLLILSATLFIGIGSLFFLQNQQETVIKINMQQQGNAISTLVAEDLAKLIYFDDPDVASNISQRLKAIPEVHSAYFFDKDFSPVLTIQNKNQTIPKHSIRIKTSIVYESVALGHANFVFFSPKLNEQKDEINQIFLFFVSMMVVLSLLFILFIDNSFIRRLSELSQALNNATKNKDFVSQLDVVKEDEIGQARLHFNQLIQMVKEKTEDLEFKAHHDNLTGLYNRHYLLHSIEESLNDPEGCYALCYIDLDQFKVVNDTCGHFAGDELLKQLSETLLSWVKTQPKATLGRIGGDEFILLIKDENYPKMLTMSQEIHALIRGFQYAFQERHFYVGASIGIITYQNTDSSAQDLLSAADAVCYQAKNEGRDKAIIYDIKDPQLKIEKSSLSWVSRLYSALENNLFELYWQPIVELKQQNAPYQHFETLIRLNYEGEAISPALFIPIAERYGLSKRIDLWVIKNLCQQLQNQSEFLAQSRLISLNLSADTLMDETLISEIDSLFEKYDIPYHKICFEITETGIISNFMQAQTFIHYFATKGIKFSLDDFGTGMSSFGYLSQLPVSYLKIDGGFIKEMVHNPVMKEMVIAMNRIGQITRKEVIAEYVETPEIISLLKEIGIQYAQGYYYSQPKPITDFLYKFDGKE